MIQLLIDLKLLATGVLINKKIIDTSEAPMIWNRTFVAMVQRLEQLLAKQVVLGSILALS